MSNDTRTAWAKESDRKWELTKENQQQAETIKQLEARVGRLEGAILARAKRRYSEAEKPEAIKAWVNALVAIANESPQQSLAAIQADAIEKAVRQVRQQIPADNEFGSIDACYTYKLINYAADIRQQADKG